MSLAPACNKSHTNAAGDGSTIASLFVRQARRTPDALALITCDGKLTYRELDERSNRLAERLQSLGLKSDTLAGVAMERSEALVVSLLAVLKAGGAYVPLDPLYPAQRLAWIIEDSAMPVLLTTSKTRHRLASAGTIPRILNVDEEHSGSGPFPLRASAIGSDLAYVIYTSGSTGKPKGVMVENRNVANFFAGMDQVIGSEPGVWLAVTSVSFDISVLELLWTLTRGFTIVLHGDEGTATIADEIRRNGVTHLQMTPSLAHMLTLNPAAFAALGSLRAVLLGGEAVPASLIRHLRQVFRGAIYNMYGPTETTIWSTCGRVDEIGTTVSIGRPILNTEVFVLDPERKPVADGEVGELFIAGEGVARGYWNRPDLTAERFLSIPGLSGFCMYRTGDLAKFRPDGNLEFLGRADYQIKLRGHRIEPGEIEAALEECPGVRRAVVVLREEREGDKRLVAYLTGTAQGTERGSTLRKVLESKLPDYMIPTAFVFLAELPLTDNGKVDRKALLKLPTPSLNAAEPLDSGKRPVTEIEKMVAAAWRDALGVPAVGLHDNFFDLGAHSLTVAEVHARLQDVLRHEFDLVDLYQFSTVSTLAAHLAGVQTLNHSSNRAQRRRMAMQNRVL